jgi:hypothetical protein
MGRFAEGRALPLDILRALELLRQIETGAVERRAFSYKFPGAFIHGAQASEGSITFDSAELDRLKKAGMVSFGPTVRSKKYKRGSAVTRQSVRIEPRGREFLNSNGKGWQQLPILREVYDTDGWGTGGYYRQSRMRQVRYESAE